ncbi:Hsp70-Hsp90 organizing protein 2 [Seminavis robusta]|uniref:Hsp70-Hsp90 organizing protein 2 n=1 Tax=Seminavis robusta TaxID=568900 RepID=A0A9N8E9X3_9STRA|nr:Hsp70-Hsp90 organizing protein 2 [Seminavis robusta]|eukprot:Sro669_g184530.1 Hsp70-Hsp90 organizing protein 2 (156) ;mRNA; f:22550-23108
MGKDTTMHSKNEAQVKRYLDMGNNAFRDERWDDAITYYTQAISKGDKEYQCYSNRSAAYLKKGDLLEALEDAGQCISIKPNYHKGHIRRVAVYHQMEEYEDAIEAYKAGLEHCPNDKTLQKGLRAAQKKVHKLNHPQDEEPPEEEAEKVLKTFQF